MKFTQELTNTFKNVASLIKKSKNIILMPHAKMDCDGMSASVALHLILNKFNKHSTTVCSDPVPEAFAFLPSSDIFSQELIAEETATKQFHIKINNTDKKFKNLEYSVEDGKVNIILFSEDTPFQESDFTFIGAQLKPDLIITLDSGDTYQLGKMYADNKELFEEVPVINIDHHFSNTQFGDVNLVEHTSSSTTQLIYNLIPFLEEEFRAEENTDEKIQKTQILDANISTLILAGMLTDTGSFQHSNTTPEALDIASILIEHGAEHQKIVKQLFKTKSLSTLKIWGKVLTKLQKDPLYKIVWSSVSRNDLEETGSHSDDTNDLIDDLMATTPDTELVLLVKEREDNIISTSVRSSSDDVDSIAFTSIFGGGGHKQAAGFKIRDRGGKSFEEIVSDIVFEAKLFQAKRLHVEMPKRGLEHLINTEEEKEKTEDKKEIPEISKPLMPDFPDHLEKITEEENIEEEEPEIETNIKKEQQEVVKKEKVTTDTEEKRYRNTAPQEQAKKIEAITPLSIPTPENTDLFGEPIVKNNEELSEEEIPYAEHKEYFEISQPEKYIEKESDEDTNYDDFADFLAKSDEDEEVEYLTETETATPKSVSQNPFPNTQETHEREENTKQKTEEQKKQRKEERKEEKELEELDPFLASLDK